MIGLQFPWRKRVVGPPRPITLVWPAQGAIVGALVAMTDGEATYLTDLEVNPEFRGQGIGTKLMNELIAQVGNTNIILMTADAEAFYEKFGFTPRQAMIRRPTSCAE